MQKKLAKPYNKPSGALRLSSKAVQKIAAVEGIDTTGEVDKEFAEFDRLGLTAEQRIAAIKARFGKSSA